MNLASSGLASSSSYFEILIVATCFVESTLLLSLFLELLKDVWVRFARRMVGSLRMSHEVLIAHDI